MLLPTFTWLLAWLQSVKVASHEITPANVFPFKNAVFVTLSLCKMTLRPCKATLRP